MFGRGPTHEQFDALANLVTAQSKSIEASQNLVNILSSQVDHFINDARAAAQKAKIARAETHLLKALSAALIAEVSAKSDDPYAELSSISKRIRFTAKEFSGDDAGADYVIKDAIKMICQHAEKYLKRGDPAGKIDA